MTINLEEPRAGWRAVRLTAYTWETGASLGAYLQHACGTAAGMREVLAGLPDETAIPCDTQAIRLDLVRARGESLDQG